MTVDVVEEEKVGPHLIPRPAVAEMPRDVAHALPEGRLTTLGDGLEARHVTAEPAHADAGEDAVQVVVDNVRDPGLLVRRVEEGAAGLEAGELAYEEGRRG